MRKSPSETTSVFASGWQIVCAMGFRTLCLLPGGNLKLHFFRRRIGSPEETPSGSPAIYARLAGYS